MRGKGNRRWECDDATRVISPNRSAWRLLPTTITPASPAAAPLCLAIPEPGKPRSGCGSTGGAFLVSRFFFAASFFSPRIRASADHSYSHDKRERQPICSTAKAQHRIPSPATPTLQLGIRFQSPTSARVEGFPNAPPTSTCSIRIRRHPATSPSPTSSLRRTRSTFSRIWASAEQP